MPQWLIDALRTQKLSKADINSVIKKVNAADKAHDALSARIEPTEEELNQRVNYSALKYRASKSNC